MTTDRSTVLAGGELAVVARFDSASGRALGRIAGIATSPGGDSVDLAFEAQPDGSWRARFAPTASAAAGLWEVHAFAASDDGEVARDAKLAFGAGAPTARLAGGTIATQDDAPALGVDVEVASPGRYNVSAVLYATDGAGTLVPAAIAHAAAVLQPGQRSLPLRFATDTLDAAGLSAPYEVRDLVLSNQGDLGVIEKRARAFALEWTESGGAPLRRATATRDEVRSSRATAGITVGGASAPIAALPMKPSRLAAPPTCWSVPNLAAHEIRACAPDVPYFRLSFFYFVYLAGPRRLLALLRALPRRARPLRHQRSAS